ncbi:Glyoxalase/bleomycin resistance protein/dioxygenase [Alteromonas sp. 38]|uniref:VOC family protein n=1 Tax=unclassified Alteromonas TaxID=2614992 RepID=UPI0012EFCCBF|nr:MULTISPECIES: VOC family protein [unclassified Alteromonas]CAD5254468.1 Glyoxalase/bleomycin resistance protein/dioxygenase [Alteromonas sp. 154]VXB03859.1 Glyoxalase/bleomycin resistance protein/dioxygenase [Alteromonas sp. 38]
MIGYVTIGTADLAKSGMYYDALLGTIGATRFMEEPNYFIAWSRSQNDASLAVSLPFNKEPATVGNGTMVAIALETPEQVKAFYNKAIELGGTDEGTPGFRPQEADSGFYAGYFRDLDGNKLNAFCMVEESVSGKRIL